MYNVAFRYTREAKGYHGVVIWTSFANKEDFDKWYTPDLKAWQEVVEEGISEKRAIELTRQTPLACRIAAGIQESTVEGGEVNLDILVMKVKTVLFVEHEAI